MSNTDIVTGTLIILFSTFLLAYAVPRQINLGFGSKGGVSPRTLPYGIAVVMMLCGLKILYNGYQARKRAATGMGQEEKNVFFYLLSFTIVFVGFVGSALLEILGYPLISVVMMLLMYYFSGGKKLWVGAVLAVAFTMTCMLFFSTYLQLAIPFGFGF
jgi:hypothetical protein